MFFDAGDFVGVATDLDFSREINLELFKADFSGDDSGEDSAPTPGVLLGVVLPLFAIVL